MDDFPAVKHVSVQICEDKIEQGAKDVLREIRPYWKSCDIKFKLLTDGITNKLVGCYLTDSPEDVVLVRVYGQKTDLLIDRKAETRNIILLHNENLAPQLYATFKNGLAYEYVPGKTLTHETVIKPKIYKLVAAKMANLHLVKLPADQNHRPMLWDTFYKFYDLVPDKFTQLEKQMKFKELICSKQRLLEEIKYLEKMLTELNSPVVFSHNDLLLGNVIHNSDNNSVTFIDYEYAAMNYQAFDIGNHFAEFAGVENVDHSRYPSKELQFDWLRTYLKVFRDTSDISEEEIERLYIQVNKFSLASHLLWGIWALIQAEHSTINFEYIPFAAIRLNEYFAKKDQFSALKYNKL